jgi:hypothetical protein
VARVAVNCTEEENNIIFLFLYKKIYFIISLVSVNSKLPEKTGLWFGISIDNSSIVFF